MTESQRLQIKASEQRSRLNELAAVDTLTDDQRGELNRLTAAYSDTEAQTRATILAESEQAVEVHATPDAEDRERAALRDKATVSGFLMAAMAGRLPSGAEAAYSDACGVDPGKIPLDIFESDRPKIEQHADATTPSPTTGTGTTVGRVLPYVFDQSIAARKLGIGMPTVPSGAWSEMALTTPPGTAAAKAKGSAIESTAGVLSPVSTTARRISARLSLTAEDIAEVGTAKFEAAVRSALSGSLSDQYDIQCLRGDGQSPNISGLMSQLDTPDPAPTVVASFDSLLQTAAGFCGTKYAEQMTDVSILVPPDVYRLSIRLFRDAGENHRGDVSAQKYLQAVLSSWSTATRLQNAPASGDAANISTGIIRRMGPGSDSAAIHPIWGHLSVDDIFTSSGSATGHFSVHVLVGAKVLLVRPAGEVYDLVSYKVA